MKFAILAAALALSVTQLPAQRSGTPDSFAVQARQASLAPLSLLTNGPGRIVPFEDGQMLQVGRDYTMAAVAEPGFGFDHWIAVYVFTFTEYFIDPSGATHMIITKVFSATPFHSDERVLKFTMQPTELIYNDPGVRMITRGVGWQVNFVPNVRSIQVPALRGDAQ